MANGFTPVFGNYGSAYLLGRKVLGLKSFELNQSNNYTDFPITGTLTPGKKYAGYELSGSMGLYFMDSEFKRTLATAQDFDTPPPVFEDLLVIVEDPSKKKIAVRLTNVQFTDLTIIAFEAGSLMEDEFEFTAERYEILPEDQV